METQMVTLKFLKKAYGSKWNTDSRVSFQKSLIQILMRLGYQMTGNILPHIVRNYKIYDELSDSNLS